MCNCIKETTEASIKHITETVGAQNIYKMLEQRYAHIGYPLSGGVTKIGVPFIFSYIAKKKNGEPEKRTTNYTATVYPSFCPFCGEKLEKDSGEKIG